MNPYIPDSLPITNLDYQLLVGLVGNANAELARYDGLLQGIPNPAVMLSPLTTQEAVLSSKIEGTQATVDEVLEQEADWNGWIAFFLQAITHQSKENGMRVRSIMGLYENMKNKIHEITHSQYSLYLLDAIFTKPIFKTSDCAARLKQDHNVHEKTTLSLLRQLKEYDVLKELQSGSGRRAATLCFPKLINLAEGKAVL